MSDSSVEKPYLILLTIVGVPSALLLLWACGIIPMILSAIWAVLSPILTVLVVVALAPFALMLLAAINIMSK